MERFALKSFNVANLMHWAASLATPGQAPSPDQMLGLFRVLEGAEIRAWRRLSRTHDSSSPSIRSA
jgi:hypothetical protein